MGLTKRKKIVNNSTKSYQFYSAITALLDCRKMRLIGAAVGFTLLPGDGEKARILCLIGGGFCPMSNIIIIAPFIDRIKKVFTFYNKMEHL
jgi:hypothetical protein